jgi:hypothetical protein
VRGMDGEYFQYQKSALEEGLKDSTKKVLSKKVSKIVTKKVLSKKVSKSSLKRVSEIRVSKKSLKKVPQKSHQKSPEKHKNTIKK